MMIVAVVADLFFEAKVRGTAGVVGAEVICVRSAAAARERLGDTTHLIVDLGFDEDDGLSLISAAKAAEPPVRVTAYLAHVQRELAERARAAGADAVLPRSKFVEQLPALLRGAGCD